MKKLLLAAITMSCASALLAQGTVNFNNRVATSGPWAPVYGPEAGNTSLSLHGNTSTGIPSGTQVYTGAPLAGSAYSAVLFAAPGANAAESSLVASPTVTVFRTGAGAGFVSVPATAAVLPGVAADAAVATLQLRAWDNKGGTITTWADAEAAWLAGTIAAGKSATFNVSSIGGTFNAPPNLSGLTSFNIYYNIIPEPSTFALLGLGALGMMIFRRK
ncbi:MAG TPA: PEP-CTERM sorting domain-containing protein [Verrucomicrobiae bacterium]